MLIVYSKKSISVRITPPLELAEAKLRNFIQKANYSQNAANN